MKKRSPKIARWILCCFRSKAAHESLIGDFDEIYRVHCEDKGKSWADLWYWYQVLKALPSFLMNSIYWRMAMFRNYLKIVLRNLFKHRYYSLINIVGLAIGISCCLFILLYDLHELSYDRYHEKADRIHRLTLSGRIGDSEFRVAALAAPTAGALMKDFPEVSEATRLYTQTRRSERFVRHRDKTFKETRIVFADANMFDVFTVPLLKGDPVTALAEPNTIVISGKTAQKYFGNEDPMGQILTFDGTTDYEITGVFHDIPSNSHFHFNFIPSLVTLDDSRDPWWLNNLAFRTYVLLKEGTNPRQFEDKFPDMVRKYIGPMMEQFREVSFDELLQSGLRIDYHLQSISDIHLHSNLEEEFEPNGDIKYVIIFSVIAFFILVLACINFMNLSTARSIHRAREVGIRKVVGSTRHQLILQFLAESTIMSFMAMIFALIFVAIILPSFNQVAGKVFVLNDLTSGTIPVALVGIVIFPGILAGLYPAMFLSSFKPISVLKLSCTRGLSSRRLRSALVVFQFTISIALITGTVVVDKQLDYIQHKNLGFNQERVVIVHDAHVLGEQIESFKNELLQYPEIESATVSGFLPVTSERMMDVCCPEGLYRENGTPMQRWLVDYDYIKTLGMEIVEGRNFSRGFSTDSSAIIINEAAVKHFGWNHPIGKVVGDYTAPPERRLIDWPVIGVVKDFHFESLRDRIGPLILHLASSTNLISFRVKGDQLSETVRRMKNTWQDFELNHAFEFSFLDDRFNAMYGSEQRIGRLFGVFAGLAVFIGCLGLLGLAAFTAEQRTREIGIRKILGSSISGIIVLLSKTYMKWVLIANLIAWPISYFAMRYWLRDFAYHTGIGALTFILSGGLAFGIAFLTVSYQAFRAAQANPVDSLKYE